ncbi:MAG: trypsin-like peptidase domain-containing protein [Armatimonadetes bacterium]|nr:trypsin-like peptidase domain-containing protein [Armatimonadota bacterium]
MFKLDRYAQYKHADPMKQVIQHGAKASCTVSVVTRKDYSTGSGFHVGHGLVVTAAHVLGDDVNPATSISVTFDGVSMYPARLVLREPKMDAAVLKVLKAPDNLGVIEFGDSDKVQIGDMVAVVSSPEGFHDTSMVGRVTNVHQSPDLGGNEPAWTDLLLIDVTLLPGSSGGMVLDETGLLVGIVLGVMDRTGQQQPLVGLNSVEPSNKLAALVNKAFAKVKR